MNQVLINATHQQEICIAFIQNKKLTELNFENAYLRGNKKNIYKGIVAKIESSLDAAFIDYGKKRNGFLSLRDIVIKTDDITKKENEEERKVSISDVLKVGQSLLVQVIKEERGNKGAALSTEITLSGTYLILKPNSNNPTVGISKQISTNDKKKLQTIIPSLKIPEGIGLIIRTIAADKTNEELEWELEYLLKTWENVKKHSEEQENPVLILQEDNIIIRTLKNYLRENIDSIYIDNKKIYEEVKLYINWIIPDYKEKIKFFDHPKASIFNYFKIEKTVNQIFFNQNITLKSGATITFDPTEALTAIDINSAKATTGKNIEETAFQINIEAAKEIPNQLKLRDIGGLVVIDFIDMISTKNQEEVEKTIKSAFKNDKARIEIGNISKFGLLELSRQRIGSAISQSWHKECHYCNGKGQIPKIPSLAIHILKEVKKSICKNLTKDNTTLHANREIITYLINEKRDYLLELENECNAKIYLIPYSTYDLIDYKIYRNNSYNKKINNSYPEAEKTPSSINANDIEKPLIKKIMPDERIPQKKQSIISKLKEKIANLFSTPKKPKRRKYYKKNRYKKNYYKTNK